MFTPNELDKLTKKVSIKIDEKFSSRRLYYKKRTNSYHIKINGFMYEVYGYNEDETVYCGREI